MIVAALNAAMILTGWLLQGIRFAGEVPLAIVLFAVSSVVYSLLAVLILSRHPRYIIGWLFLIISFFSIPTMIPNAAQLTPESSIRSELVLVIISYLAELSWIIALILPLTLILQFFPDGRLPSRRWWPLPLVTVLGMLLVAAGQPAALGQSGNEEFLQLMDTLTTVFLLSASLGSLAAVVVRFLRSQDVERLQMKWLVYTAVAGILLMFLLLVFLDDDSLIITLYTTSLPTLLAVAVAIAILRYRLFDIDIIIRRTLQYAVITAILALVYFGLVVILQALFAAVGDIQSPIFIVISTLVIAGLFNPVRIRVQNTVDRRFYRQKYQSEQALAQFAVTARDEVDMDRLAAALLDIVEETMSPERASLTLFVKKKE